MALFKLNRDGDTLYVSSSERRMREAMYLYIKAERAKGRSLDAIMFAWVEIHVTTTKNIWKTRKK